MSKRVQTLMTKSGWESSRKSPLAFVEAELVEGAADAVAGVVIEARLDAAVGLEGVIAIVVERVAVGFEVFGVVDEQAELGDVLLMETDVAGVKIVAAHEVSIDDADACDGVGDGGEGFGGDEGEVAAAIECIGLASREAKGDDLTAGGELDGREDIGAATEEAGQVDPGLALEDRRRGRGVDGLGDPAIGLAGKAGSDLAAG